jgi:hypothetical protein
MPKNTIIIEMPCCLPSRYDITTSPFLYATTILIWT